MYPTRLLAAIGATACALAQGPSPWIYFDSAETRQPPRLVLTLADDSERVVTPALDTVLIEYLGDRAFAGLPSLAVDMADRNRSLLRFELPAGIALKHAELVAMAHPSRVRPRGDTTLRVHRVESAWDGKTTWRTAPRFAAAAAVLKVPFAGGEVRVDLTAAAAAWLQQPAQNFGVLLRGLQDDGPPQAAAAPVAPPAADSGLQRLQWLRAMNQRLLHCLPWQTSAAAALQQAERSGKLVFAFVIADAGPTGSAHERALAVTALLDPDVQQLLLAHFVPLRLQTQARVHLGPQPVAGDPLLPLGTDGVRAKAPALVVSRPDGGLVAELASVGTWSKQLLVGLLLQAIGEAAPAGRLEQLRQASLRGDGVAAAQVASDLGEALLPADALRVAAALLAAGDAEAAAPWLGDARSQGADAAALAYCRGELAWLTGAADDARGAWQRAALAAAEDSPWRLRAELRAGFARGIDDLAPARPIAYRAGMAGTERARSEAELPQVVQDAARYLRSRQQPDGSFPHPGQPTYDAAVTALCGKALDAAGTLLPAGDRQAAMAAAAQAERWLGDYVRDADPVTADSFGAAYLLDFLVARAPRSDAARQLVPAAVALLLGGQLDNGAFSYSRRFGQGWKGGFGSWPKTDRGRAHSINTGIALWALGGARRAGFAVADERLQAAVKALQQMQETAVTFTYTWPDPRCFTGRDQSIGKAPVCLQALVAAAAAPAADLEQAVQDFLRWRHNLRATVKLTSAWIGPSGTSSYFFVHAYYHAAAAVVAAGGEDAAARLSRLRGDLLACAEADGTWVDYEESGKTYGTAMALLVLTMRP